MYLPGLQTPIGGPGTPKILIRCLVYQMLEDEEEGDCLYMSRMAALYVTCVCVCVCVLTGFMAFWVVCQLLEQGCPMSPFTELLFFSDSSLILLSSGDVSACLKQIHAVEELRDILLLVRTSFSRIKF